MNKRQVIILWAIAIALGGTVAVVKLTQKDARQSATARSSGQELFESFPAEEIAAVEIQGADQSVTLTKKDGKWSVVERDGYPANNTAVHEFIRALDDLKVTQGIEAGPTFAPRFGMDPDASKPEEHGLTTTFKNASGNEIAKVTLGKNIESSAESPMMGGAMTVGRYIRNHADESGFYAISETFPSISADPARWLNDDFISPEKIKSISLTQKGKDEIAWKLVRETEDAEFKLDGATGDEVLNTSITSPLKNLYAYARFEDVVTTDKAAERADTENRRTATIETFEGVIYTITLTPAKDTEDKQLLTVSVSADLPKERKKAEGEKPEDAKKLDEAFAERLKALGETLEKAKSFEGRTYEVNKSMVEPLLKEREALIVKATATPPAANNGGSVQQLPGGIIAKPPGQAATKPIEAVTPPIAVPPLETEKKTEKKSEAGKK